MGIAKILQGLSLIAALCLAPLALAHGEVLPSGPASIAVDDHSCATARHHGDHCASEVCGAIDCCSPGSAGIARARPETMISVAPQAQIDDLAAPTVARFTSTPPFRPPIG